MHGLFFSVIWSCVAFCFQLIMIKITWRYIKKHDSCKNNISFGFYHLSWLCPVIAMGAIFVLSSNQYPFSQLFFMVLFYGILTTLTCIDSILFLLPRVFTLLLLITGIVARFFNNIESLYSGLLNSAFFFFCGISVRYFYAKRKGFESFGLGDVFLMAGTGMWFSFDCAWYAVVIASVLGIVFSYLKGVDTYIPFGPFLCSGMVIISLVPGSMQW